MNDTTDRTDHEHLTSSAGALQTLRAQRARSRQHVRGVLDAMAAEARRYLGAVFTENDPVTNLPVALVVRSDERLPDEYESQTPRPPTDTVSRLIVDVLSRALTIEINDVGTVRASGDARSVDLAGISDVRVADTPEPATFLVYGDHDPKQRAETPFVRVLADLIDSAAQDERAFAMPDAAG